MTRQIARPALPCRRRPNSPFTFFYSLSALLLLLLVGCGTAEYERRLAARVAKGQAADKYSELGDPQELAGAGISLRLPRAFTSPPLAEGAADARRVKPSVANIPGLKRTDEGFIQDSAGGQQPYYCYVGVTNGPLQDVAAAVKNELGGKQGKTSDWSDFQGDAPDGAASPWRKLRFDGDQEFCYKNKNGQEEFQTMKGVLEVYLHEEGGQVVIVVWRMPAGIEGNVGLARLAPLVAGSVSVKK
jgi:hypothetical protein